VECGPMVNPP